MKRSIITTADGAHTIFLEEWNEQYHSRHGAVQEARHVFIKMGLKLFRNRHLRILEMGFGTGLNAFITLLEAPLLRLKVQYTGLEAYPVPKEEYQLLNYPEKLCVPEKKELFAELHTLPWEVSSFLTPDFEIIKRKQRFEDFAETAGFDLIYFDAFGARVQPELWTEIMFAKMYSALNNNGVLVTYSAKGSVRRAMQSVGFEVERLPGPPGKREMLRALKSI
ncbi:tRNA (5-methylaminomethyl-2-thiouridine)(34)-methyltransferase MnmD [Ascidiimonas aurantiaca]|uniref:tRNA (5-methylaminomethyl-2-thiouridine)(34)-methyltransferase MnmD n=1 Tax=Ascidiimonas aurantiaca TaxID=1685432 RepID=UPI0030ED5EFA